MTEELSILYSLGVALAIGLLIGVERGWQGRKQEEGERVAGIRTYGLIGLLGGCSALISNYASPVAMGLVFVGVAGVLTTVYVVNLDPDDSVGITSLVTGLLTFTLGALAVLGAITVAAATAIVITLILSYKPLLHRWVHTLEKKELHAGIKLLLISVVILPALPDQGYGPWEALNPYTIWWMVVLIAFISFIGYFAIKIGGPSRGVVFTGLFGGLASSTALTLHFSRLAKRDKSAVPMLAMGTLFACGTMFPRMLLIASMLNPYLFKLIVVPAIVMSLLTYLPVVYYWRLHADQKTDIKSPMKNPLELKAALIFGSILALVMLLGAALKEWFGDTGLLAFAGISGLVNVDTITLLLARMSGGELDLRVAAMGMVIAATTNNLTKAGMATVIGGRKMGFLVALPLLVSGIGSVVAGWYWIRWMDG